MKSETGFTLKKEIYERNVNKLHCEYFKIIYFDTMKQYILSCDIIQKVITLINEKSLLLYVLLSKYANYVSTITMFQSIRLIVKCSLQCSIHIDKNTIYLYRH